MKKIKILFILIFYFLLILPFIQSSLNLTNSKPLYGVYEKTSLPSFSIKSWYDGLYQEQYTKFFNETFGFRNDLIRLYNQIDFSLFNLTHAKKILKGKNDYLLSDQYISSWTGKDFIGKAILNDKIAEIKTLQDKLWEINKTYLLVVLCPDKATFYSELIPNRFLIEKKGITNTSYISKRCQEIGVHVIDFNPYFLKLKKNTHFPVYPKTGIHWSYYGAFLAADSFARYLKTNTNLEIPELILDSNIISKFPIAEDNDIEKTLNLLFEIPTPIMAYPKFHIKNNIPFKKPSALVIGDSFYWTWYNDGIINSLFSNSDFWYYARDVYPMSFTKQQSISEINIAEIIRKQNIIILLQVNGAYGDIGWGFPKLALSVLDSANNDLIQMKKTILNNANWVSDIQKKANNQHMKFDDMLRMDALYILDENLKNNIIKIKYDF